MLPAPSFHHLHLNFVDLDAAIEFYLRQFPASAKTSWAGLPALAGPNDVLILFSRVATAPAMLPQTALWHFGWHVTDARASLETYKRRPDVTLLPLYTTDEGGDEEMFLEELYSLGDTRAVMNEGPSREALELVEIA